MKASALLNPGTLGTASALRQLCAVVLSELEVGVARSYPLGHPEAVELAAFFTDCAAKATALAPE